MFSPDVIALKEFYASRLGEKVARIINQSIYRIWRNGKGNNILGIGFAIPYLEMALVESSTVFALMPPAQGVLNWGNASGNLSLLADEAELPFHDNSIHRVLLAHALENSEYGRHMMAEIWRILAPGGRILIMVPNRMGIWARSPRSPFAYGQPFTSWQLKQLCAEHSFTALESESVLFFPPGKSKYLLRCASMLEKIGRKIFPGFGGVILMEAEKQIYATHKRKIRNYAILPGRSTMPKPAMPGIATKD